MGGKQRTSRLVSFVAAILGLLLIVASGAGGAIAGAPSAVPANEGAAAGAAQQQSGVVGPIISQDIKHDVSPPLTSIRSTMPAQMGALKVHPLMLIERNNSGGQTVVDSVVQKALGPLVMPTTIANFEGMYNQWGGTPPDTVGDVGPNHYVQMVNKGFQVFSKTGASLYGPFSTNDLFIGFGGICEANNQGDVIVLYDQLADRWMLSQFAFNSQAGPTYQCIAVSTTGDPAGSYYRYAFLSAPIGFDDYPHYGVWPNAYYMTANRFNGPGGFAGANIAYERQAMLAGTTARLVQYSVLGDGGALAADLDGYALPTDPNTDYIFYPTNPDVGLVNMYKFMVNWSNPIVSSFTGPMPVVGVAPVESTVCTASRGACVPQPDTVANLETISDRFMHRIAYRKFATHESVVANQTVNATGTIPGIAGVRWYEFRGVSTTPTVYQQGTFAPNDGLYRWMGSVAMDGQGNISVGYSVSSEQMYPSIRYAGRLVSDPLGELSQGEGTMFNGTGSADYPSAPRWGDYSSMNIDIDDCTFWYTQEYFRTTGLRNWRTRVGSFRFPGCSGIGATPTATTIPSATATVCPIQFIDVPPGHTFYETVHCLACRGVVSGYADGTFRPNNPVTRGQLSKMVSNAAGFFEDPNPQIFQDVLPGHTFYDFINRLTRRGHMTGYQCGSPGEPCIPPDNKPYFRPFANATRGQTSKIVSNAAGFTEPPVGQTFQDVPPSHTFYAEIQRLASRNVMGGYPCGGPFEPCVGPENKPYFRPGNDVTRGQSAKIVANTFFPNCQPRVPTPGPTMTATAIATVCPGGIRTTGSITTTDPVQTGRVNHHLLPASFCDLPKACPALEAPALARHYDSYTYMNSTGAAQCVTVNIGQNCGDNAAMSIAYLGTYDPNNLCANYLADGGGAGPEYTYSFNLPAGASAVVVVYENSPNIGCEQYTITINPCQPGQPTRTPMPTNTPQATNTPTITPTAGACAYTVATATATFITGGTRVDGAGCDDCTTNITLPFPVTVYGTPVTSAFAGSNGTLQFAAGSTKPFFYDGCMPIDPTGAGGDYFNTLFLHYDDLMTVMTGTNTCPGCGIYTQTLGVAPNRQFVVRWNTTYFNHNGETNFEAVLTEGLPVISAIYGASDNNGAEAVAGIQRDLAVYTQFSCNQAILTPGLRLNYTPQNCALMPRAVGSP